MSIADKSSSDLNSRQLPVVLGRDAGRVDDFEALLGDGHDLWSDDAEFNAFLNALRRWRNQDREGSRRQ